MPSMIILNKEELDDWLWEHRENGTVSVRGTIGGERVNIAWKDIVTGEIIYIEWKTLPTHY